VAALGRPAAADEAVVVVGEAAVAVGEAAADAAERHRT
jgi:hypothetical protein